MDGLWVAPGRTVSRRYRRRAALLAVSVAGASMALIAGVLTAIPASAQGSAPGAPGANATWNDPSVTGFADSLGSSSKVWYTVGNGELENAFYPETDTPDTLGLQYAVTNGSSFTRWCGSRSTKPSGWVTPATPIRLAVTSSPRTDRSPAR